MWEKVGGSSNLRILTPESYPRWAPTVHPPHNQSPTSAVHPAKSYAEKTSPKPKYPPKTPPKQLTPPKVRSFSPGWEKFEKLLDFKKQLNQERKSSPRPEPPHSTPSSPKQLRTIRPPSTPSQRSMPPTSMTILKPQKKGPTPLLNRLH